MPEVSVIIPTLNSRFFIGGCLQSVFSQEYQNFEVIVVDNGSQDQTCSFIKNKYPQVILVENEKNLGAAKARNQGIDIAKGRWLLTLDCDVILRDNFLGELMACSTDYMGMLQPKILHADRRRIYSCGVFLSKMRRFYDIGKDSIEIGEFSEGKDIFGVCSAAGFYNRAMLNEIKERTGYFDERFFFLVEDVDLAWRAREKGWHAFFCPDAVCYHSGNSSGISYKFRQYLCFRNRYFMIKKNEKGALTSRLPYLLLYDIPRLLFLLVTNRLTLRALREVRDFNKTYV